MRFSQGGHDSAARHGHRDHELSVVYAAAIHLPADSCGLSISFAVRLLLSSAAN